MSRRVLARVNYAGVLLLMLSATGSLWAAATGGVVVPTAAQDRTEAIAQRLDVADYAAAKRLAELELATLRTGSAAGQEREVLAMMLLGDALFGLSDWTAAASVYGEADQLLRRLEGLYSLRRRPLLHRQGAAFEQLAQLDAANDQYEIAHNLVVRAFERDSPEVVSSTQALATWYARHGHFGAAAALYRQALDVTTLSPLSDVVAQINLLRDAAWNDRQARFPAVGPSGSFSPSWTCCGTDYEEARRSGRRVPSPDVGETERVLLTLEAVLSGFNSDAGRAALRQAKIEFGDWYYLHGYKTDALTKYREAIRLMSTAEIEATFAQPQALHLPHPGNPGQVLVRSESERPPGRGNIEVAVSVSSRGSISGRPRIVSLTPADVVPFKYVRAVRFGVYRPAIVDGKFRKSKDFRIRFAFDH